MKSLRNRIAALLILAIVTVVGLATFAASQALQPPQPEATMEPIARQIHILAALARRNREDAAAAGLTLSDRPAPGMQEPATARFLMRALQRTGKAKTVIVTKGPGAAAPTASVDLGNNSWLVLEIPEFRPPPGGWMILAGWITLIVIGSTIISVFAASKITKPLQLLESAMGRIGTDGALPHIPEVGSSEVRATAKALNQVSARLKSAMESRMRLVAAAGHDLRTPMTRMRLRAEFITGDDERQKWLRDIEELDQIADSAIGLIREEVRQDHLETIDVGDLLYEVVDELKRLGYRATISQPMRLFSVAGPVALKRALRNLIINAATHGEGANVELAKAETAAVITIFDDGPGIPEELLGQIFEPFFRVDRSRSKSFPGAGLGLAIAKEIIERFGGTITIANRKPTGLTQIVTLPLADDGNIESIPQDSD